MLAPTRLAVLAFALATPPALAQPEGVRWTHGLVAGLAGSTLRTDVDTLDARWHVGPALQMGYRLCRGAGCVTPHVALTVTSFGGLDERLAPPGAYTFADLEWGAFVSVRAARRLRPYALLRRTIGSGRTSEVVEGGRLLNYTGAGWTAGGGVEVPLTRGGRGLDVGLAYSSGV